MAYISVADAAKRWNLSERSVRNYCAIGKIPNAVLAGKTWQIPEDAEKPKRTNAKVENALLSVLREEKKKQRKGGIYHKVQIDLTYNSNHIEGSRLTHDQTRYIFEANTNAFLTRSAGEIPPRLKKSKRRFPNCCPAIMPSQIIRSNKSLHSITTSSAFIRSKTAMGVSADLSFSKNVLKITLSRLLSRMT